MATGKRAEASRKRDKSTQREKKANKAFAAKPTPRSTKNKTRGRAMRAKRALQLRDAIANRQD